MVLKPIDSAITNFLKYQIESGTNQQIKRALQEICGLYRTGYTIGQSDQLRDIELFVNGLIYTKRDDEKIRRWALNAIAQFGRRKYSINGVTHALENYSDEPQTIGSAIAALFAITNDAQKLLYKKDAFPIDLVVLAALQRVKVSEVDVSQTRINIEHATPDILKLALVIVGMARAPEHIFHPRHSNAEIVKVLGGHHDQIVSQYSIWAIVENSDLDIRQLGIDLKDIEAQPANVRSWLFRLIAMNPNDVKSAIEYIKLGIKEVDVEARMGLAIGLLETYSDGLENLILEWYYNEKEIDIRDYILDHLVKHAYHSRKYEENVLLLYKDEVPSSSRRYRMEVMAARTRIFGKLKKLSLEEPDLLSETVIYNYGVLNMTKIKTGDIKAAVVSVGGNAVNKGQISDVYNVDTTEALQIELGKAIDVLDTIDLDANLKAEVNAAIREAQADLTPKKLGAATKALRKVTSTLSGIATSAVDITKIIGAIETIGRLVA